MTDPQLSLVGNIGKDWPNTEFIGSNAILRLVDGTRSTTDSGNGRVMESFTVFSSAAPNVTQSAIKAVENRLALAHRQTVKYSPHELIQLVERLTDEVGTRVATVLGGTITAVDDAVNSRTQWRSGKLFVITIDRYNLWEYSFSQTLVAKGTSSHGGTVDIPSNMTLGTQNGRINTTAITSTLSSTTKKFWMGIKSSNRQGLSSFDPEIIIRSGYININSGFSTIINDGAALDNECVHVHFTSQTDWARAVDIHLVNFNASSAVESTRDIYHGRYHLLMRYKTNITDRGETFGVRAKYGWATDTNAVTNNAVYLKNTGAQYRYVDLGLITIGGDGFSPDIVRRAKLSNFGIAIQVAVWDYYFTDEGVFGRTGSAFYIDNMFLVPADNYVHAELGAWIGGKYANRKIELYTRDDDSVYCFSIERYDQDRTRDSLVYTSNPRKVFESAPIVDSEEWAMPPMPSKLVFVADGGPVAGLPVSAAVDLQLQTILRTANT
jgi:hypothetical protein